MAFNTPKADHLSTYDHHNICLQNFSASHQPKDKEIEQNKSNRLKSLLLVNLLLQIRLQLYMQMKCISPKIQNTD